MMEPHKFHDGSFWFGKIGFHRFRVVGGEYQNGTPLGERHVYDHMMELKRTEPPGATVELYAETPDGLKLVQPWSDLEDTWYVARGVAHFVKAPEGVVAHLRCYFSLYDENGKIIEPLECLRGPSPDPEAYP